MLRILKIIALLWIGIGAAAAAPLKPLDPELEGYPYGYAVHSYRFTSQNQPMTMAYMDVRPPSFNGKNVLLLHGKNFNAAYWKTTIELLTSRGFRVIAPDQIGFGKSTKPGCYHYTFQQLARNTKGLLEALGVKKTALLGHSMGGMLATRFALMYPETTEKLILLNPIGLEDWKLKVPYVPIESWYANELKKDYDAIRRYQQASYYDGKWKPEYDEWVNILAGWTLHEAYPRIAWNAALTYDMIFTQPVVYEFKELTMPTLLIIGTRDRTALGKNLVGDAVRETMGRYDRLGREVAAQIPRGRLAEIEGIGHLPHIEAFGRFKAALMPFLER